MSAQCLKIGKGGSVTIPKRGFERTATRVRQQRERDRRDARRTVFVTIVAYRREVYRGS